MTGTHGVHVALGILWLVSWFAYSFSPRFDPHRHAVDVETAGLYWHFVDIVWIVIFTAVYLIEYV
jgi:heme/copper-type cytochrome/quinol oxidase subunit 3